MPASAQAGDGMDRSSVRQTTRFRFFFIGIASSIFSVIAHVQVRKSAYVEA